MKARMVAAWVAAGVVVAGMGAALAGGLTRGWDSAAADAGLRACAWASVLAHRVPLGLFLPVIAVTLSFRVGSGLGRHVRRSEARAVTTPRRFPVVHTLILFGLASLISLLYITSHNLLP